MASFSEHLYNQFPYFFRENDTYKDNEGRGIFQRYLSALGSEWDNGSLNTIPGLDTLTDAELVGDKQLVHLADVLGNPPDTFGNEPRYRVLLKYITHINKYKGTLKGYQLLFSILGVEVTIEEITLTSYKYDSGNQYDTDIIYDGNCPPCSFYVLHITDPDGNCPEIGQAQSNVTLRQLLNAIVAYVEPLNAVLKDITYEGTSLEPDWILSTGFWDDTKTWLDTGTWID